MIRFRHLREAAVLMFRLLAVLSLSLMVSCSSSRHQYGTIDSFVITSRYLEKEMRVSVLLPEGYSTTIEYPVLYFVPYGGGGAVAVTRIVQGGSECVTAFRSGMLVPLIIVGVPHDASFLIDSNPPHQEAIVAGIALHQGYYESFFLKELIPAVEQKYSTARDAENRYIGGYSSGGHAALRIGLTYPTLFSRVGGHSPTLFVGAFPNSELERFLYPDPECREVRDPIDLALGADPADHTKFYIDTGSYDINRAGCELLFSRLTQAKVAAEIHFLSGTHGISYLEEHMAEYLRFYAEVHPRASRMEAQ